MYSKKKTLQAALVLLLLAAILALFHWYSAQNSKRIENQNLNYASDAARRTARHVEDEFQNALNRVSTYAYFLSEGLSEPKVSAGMLKDMEANSLFDVFRYVDAEGINLTSDGKTSNALDRDYYLNGMKGESGISVVLHSRITDNTMVSFYAPVYFRKQVIGVLRGAYWADKYLQDILSTSCFGEHADVFLCAQDGTVIAASKAQICGENLLEVLQKSGRIDPDSQKKAEKMFQKGDEGAFLCGSESDADNICVLQLPEYNYVLVQIFPKSISQNMLRSANRTGFILDVLLVLVFACYIIALLFHSRHEKAVLQQKNQEMGYVIAGVNTLFSRFVMVDFSSGTYRYLAGTRPERADFAASGSYEDFVTYLCSFLIEESDRELFAERFRRDAVIGEIGRAHV